MSRLQMGDPGLPPQSVCAYIEDMLMELAVLALQSGEPDLAGAIEAAAALAAKSHVHRASPQSDRTPDAA